MKALGMIETRGVIGAIEAADVMLKTANVSLIKKEKVQGGLIMVSVEGEVAAVKTAVDAGASAVQHLGENFLYGAHVIPRPDSQLSIVSSREEKSSAAAADTNDVVEEPAVEVDNSDTALEDYEKSLSRKRASELRELILNSENFDLTEDELLEMVKKEMIALLVQEFSSSQGKDNEG